MENNEKYQLRSLFWEATLRCNALCEFCGSRCGEVSPEKLLKNEVESTTVLKCFDEISRHMNPKDIIAFARDIRQTYNTNDPYKISEHYGIKVFHRDNPKNFTAYTTKFEGYPTIITINSIYTGFAGKVLCAHELGHALLHEDCVNHFAMTQQNLSTTVEQEANLFAIALLGDYDIDRQLAMPLHTMNNYLLKAIMDYNLQKTE